MRKSNVTYGQLETAFQELGFHVTRGEYPPRKSYVRFTSDGDDTVVLLKGGKEDQPVDAADILSAAITLDGKGVSNREKFARLLTRHGSTIAKVA